MVHYNCLKPCLERQSNSLSDRPPNKTKPQSKETPKTRKENAENCSGKTTQTEAITNGENDEDEWTVRYLRIFEWKDLRMQIFTFPPLFKKQSLLWQH